MASASAATPFSLTGSCAPHGLDPSAQLENLLGKIGPCPAYQVLPLPLSPPSAAAARS